MAERDRIARYFAPLTADEFGAFNLSDDAAILTPPMGKQLVFTTDSVIEHIHILPGATPQQFAQKLLRRNLSDLAAMGATPWRYLLNLHTPRGLDDAWFAAFALALAEEQKHFGLVLIGGDSTSGGEVIHTTLTCIGLLDGAALRRTGAQLGDDVYVSGTIGDAAIGLKLLQRSMAMEIDAGSLEFLINRYHLPIPRLALSAALRGIATACLDISDGLLADAQQLATASQVGITIAREAIPLSQAANALVTRDANLWDAIVIGGDDYELLFTAPKSAQSAIIQLATDLHLSLTPIGEVTKTAGVQLQLHGQTLAINTSGWEHT